MRKLIMISLVAALSTSVMMGCGATASNEDAEQPVATEEQEAVGMENPWVEITEDEAKANCKGLFKAPEGAENQVWMMCEELGDSSQGIGPMIQLSFTMDNINFTARAQSGASEDADIAGNYIDWDLGPDAVRLSNWKDGEMDGRAYRSVNETGYVDMLTWYDTESKISYSLTAVAEDLDGFDIEAVVDQMYNENNY